jgi:glutaconate CoA-transferase, subunit B
MKQAYSADEIMTVSAARLLQNGVVCFVGIGLPSKAANLARLTHAPDLVLIYESGPIGAKPTVLPLSIGDGELSTSADTTVSTSEIFTFWLQGGRIDVGFLGAAQVDRFANINTTVIGPYENPTVRLPGAGGAPEIAGSAGQVLIILRQNPKSFVERLDFVTSIGHGTGYDYRKTIGLPGTGPAAVITDLGTFQPDQHSKELTLTCIHPGVSLDEVRANTGWGLKVSPKLETSQPPTEDELLVLRELEQQTALAHARLNSLPSALTTRVNQR